MASPGSFKTINGISSKEGRTVYYKLKARYGGSSGGPSSHSFTSKTYSYGVRYRPDLTLLPADIGLLGEDLVKLKSEIHNHGETDAESVAVQFFTGDSESGREQISNDIVLGNVPAKGSVTAVTPWQNCSPGSYDVYVVADPGNTISECNENNNSSYTTTNSS